MAGVEKNDPGGEARLLLAYSIAMSTGGMPLLYLGDKVEQLNDYHYRNDPDYAGDSRRVHRPRRRDDVYEARHDPRSVSGRIYRGMKRMLEVRRQSPQFAGNDLIEFGTHNNSVLGYQRPGVNSTILALVNFGDQPAHIRATTMGGMHSRAHDLIRGEDVDLGGGVDLPPHGFVWLEVNPR